MAWDIENSLNRQLAIEREIREKKRAESVHSEAVLSQVAEENSARAHQLGLTPEAYKSLCSQPEMYHLYLQILASENKP